MKRIVTERLDGENRGGWGAGPWDDEPDKVQWQDERTRLPCLIVRNPLGGLCGYVGVTTAHALFKEDYSNVDHQFDIHGGLTYSDVCANDICHEVEPGEDDNVWWFGFDCVQSGDVMPASSYPIPTAEYRDMTYVTREVESLAAQLDGQRLLGTGDEADAEDA